MYTKSIKRVQGSIFPIFQYSKQGYGILGTGFFIDDEGRFLTASHVISSLKPGCQLGYLGNVPNQSLSLNVFTPISIIQNDPSKDLAVGMVLTGKLQPLNFASSSADVGQSVILCGYPLAVIQHQATVNNAKNQVNVILNVSNVRQYWQPTIMIDSVLPNSLYNKTYKTFLVQDASLNGMSGGPIFDLNGDVVGVASANFTRQIPRPNSVPLIVENGIGIDLLEVKHFVSKALNLVSV
ncbi:MAG: serine protease [Saprospiraceae bacterium]